VILWWFDIDGAGAVGISGIFRHRSNSYQSD
jgi:hypothetical protein